MAKRAGIEKSTLLKFKNETEQIKINKNNWVWKLMISAEDRIREIKEVANSLNNNDPTPLDLGNIGDLDSPVDLFMFKEENNWYGFTVNSNNNTISRFNFGSSLTNRPDGLNLGNIGNLDKPCGILPWQEDTNWYLEQLEKIGVKVPKQKKLFK